MKIRRVCWVQQLPLHYVVQDAAGDWYMFYLIPFRAVSDADLIPYRGQTVYLNDCAEYIWRFYGFHR